MNDQDFLLLTKHTTKSESTAYSMLAELYAREHPSSVVEKSLPTALKYYLHAFELGEKNDDIKIAMVYDEMGDYNSAIDWYREAAKRGQDDAMYNLGLLYSSDDGVPLNYEESIYWYLKAEKLGNIKATYNLGVMQQEGRGLNKDYLSALERYIFAGKAGHPAAAYNAGAIFELNVKDDIKALEWYSIASQLGVSEAMFEIGRMNHQGQGIVPNNERALIWLKRACELGNRNAIEYLEQYAQ